MFARRVHEAIMEHISALTDEQLKLEDRKTMTDIHKQLDVIVHSAKLSDATKALDQFHLALALKCLKTPYLEKRLSGLADVKEMINLSLRKQEYLESIQRHERARKAGAEQSEQPLFPTPGWSTPDFLVSWLQREQARHLGFSWIPPRPAPLTPRPPRLCAPSRLSNHRPPASAARWRQVVELIFGEGIHDQVVRRCVEVLGFLAMRNAMDGRLLELIWRASLDKHESVRQAIYMVLVDLTAHLPFPLLEDLYDHICTVPFPEYTSHTLALLRGFAIAAIASPHNPVKSKRWFGLEEFWQLMQDATPVSVELRVTASNFLGDLLTWQHCAAQRGIFLQRCVQQVREGSSVPQALRLCCKVLGSFPVKVRKKADSVSSVLEWLATQHQLLPAFFDDFRRAHQQATLSTNAAQQALTTALSEGGGHRAQAAEAALIGARNERMQQLQERLDFLNFCTINAPLSLDQGQLDVLWECCVVNPCCPQEEDQVFRWLELARMNSAHALSEEATRHLFTRASSLPLERLSPTAYACLEYFFRWINWKDRKYVQQEANSFTVLDLPLFGGDTLWQVALRARDEQVGKHAVTLLTQLHHCLSPELGARHTEQRRAFVSTCMASLGTAAQQLRTLLEVSQQVQASQQAQAERSHGAWSEEEALSLRIERCLTLLHLFVEEVETKLPSAGAANPNRHGTAVRGVPMRVQVTLVGGSNSPKLEVSIDSSQSVGALRSQVWQQLGQHGEWQPEAPRMLRMITAGKELKDERTTLGELKLREPYVIHVMRRQHVNPTCVTAEAPAVAMGDATPSASASDTRGAESASQAQPGDGESGAGDDVGMNPGLLLSEEGSHFRTLFELLALRDERLSDKAWQLLMMLPTNRAMQSELTALHTGQGSPPRPSPTEEDWGRILIAGPSSFKLLYSLQVVDRLMVGSERFGNGGPAETTWADSFAGHGGVRHLLRLLVSPSNDLLDERRGSQRKPCLILLLRILCQFLLAEPQMIVEALPAHPVETFDVAFPAGPADPTAAWSRRKFSSLRPGTDLAGSTQSSEVAYRLLALLERIATHGASSGEGEGSMSDAAPLMLELPVAEGSEAALDVQIAREALQLLVGVAHSEPTVLEMFCDTASLPTWLHSLLLRCTNLELRLEVCAALHVLSCTPGAAPGAEPRSVLAADGRTVHGALTSAALQLLLQVEVHNGRCRQYFELLVALLATDCSGGQPPQVMPAQLCEQLIGLLRVHGVRERRDRPELVDAVLLGFIALLHSLVHAAPELKTAVGSASKGGLIHTLFGDLFTLPLLADARRLGADAPPKCKTPETRAAALGLLAELADGSKENVAELTELLLELQQQRSASGLPRSQWHYMPAAQEKARCGYVGLKNLGATCYLNSLMQQLFMIPEFRRGILELPVPDPPPPTPPPSMSGPVAHASLLYQLQLMFGHLNESEKKWYDTRELCAAYRDIESKPINASIQMDVDEFFNLLFDQLEAALKGSTQSRILQSLFGGTVVNQIVSKEKGKLSEREEPFYTLSIEVKSKRSVLDGLAQYVEGEVSPSHPLTPLTRRSLPAPHPTPHPCVFSSA